MDSETREEIKKLNARIKQLEEENKKNNKVYKDAINSLSTQLRKYIKQHRFVKSHVQNIMTELSNLKNSLRRMV